MATLIYSERALGNIERALQLLRDPHPEAAIATAAALQSAIETLATHPLLGRRVDGDVRELVISYGQTGYVALYRFVVLRDEARVLALRPQRDLGFVP